FGVTCHSSAGSSLCDCDAHGASGARHLALGGLEIIGVEVRHLLGGNLRDLVVGDGSGGLTPGELAAFLEARGLPDKKRRRRGLEYEGERPVLVDGDLDGDDGSPLVLGCGVVLLTELHRLHTVRAEGRPDRGRGRSRPSGQLDLYDGGDAATCHEGSSSFFLPPGAQSLATWLNSSSTGVSRPNMLTSTLSFNWSSLISAIWPEKSANGPSLTLTVSPTCCWRRGLERGLWPSIPSGRPWRIASTSARGKGVGLVPGPTKPVTPGV